MQNSAYRQSKYLLISLLMLLSYTVKAQQNLADQDSKSVNQTVSRVDKSILTLLRLGADLFRGGSQGIHLFHLDTELVVRYNRTGSNSDQVSFSLASNGNIQIHGVPVYAISGELQSDLVGGVKNSSGQSLMPKGEGEVVGLSRQANIAYLIESDRSMQMRQERLNYFRSRGDGRFEPIKGRFIGIVRYFLTDQYISFYQMDDVTGNLIPSGEFKGLPAQR
jgi:hypothetical protein